MYFTSSHVSMIGHGCSVSHYPELCKQYLEKYQLLPRQYLGIFEGGNGEQLTDKKWMLELTGESEIFSGGVLKK